MTKLFVDLSVWLLNGCAFDCGGTDRERSGVDQLSERSAQWQANKLQNYQLSYSLKCFCMVDTKEITVSNGAIVKVLIKSNTGTLVREVPESEFASYYTVTGLFNLIADKDKTVDRLTVEYDASLGYPTKIDVDPVSQRCDCKGTCSSAADDEFTYVVSVSLI